MLAYFSSYLVTFTDRHVWKYQYCRVFVFLCPPFYLWHVSRPFGSKISCNCHLSVKNWCTGTGSSTWRSHCFCVDILVSFYCSYCKLMVFVVSDSRSICSEFTCLGREAHIGVLALRTRRRLAIKCWFATVAVRLTVDIHGWKHMWRCDC